MIAVWITEITEMQLLMVKKQIMDIRSANKDNQNWHQFLLSLIISDIDNYIPDISD